MNKMTTVLWIIAIIISTLFISSVNTSSNGDVSETTRIGAQEAFIVQGNTSELVNNGSSSFSSDTGVISDSHIRGRAVSINALQAQAKSCIANGTYPKEIFQLCGLKRVSGYIIDKKNKDIIIIGEVDDTSPPLYLEDFVIALRNEWLIYAPLEGNTYIYSPPSCSIDPDKDVLYQLQQISNDFPNDSNPDKIQPYLNKWKLACSQPQQVSVMGVPFDTRFAQVMVEADYYTKRLVDGSVTLGINGFTSLMDNVLSNTSKSIQEGKSISIPLSFYNRFWFSPGENNFLEDEGVVYIRKSEVVLLTEEELLTGRGERSGTGETNPFADEFAKNFSARYDEISKIKPIYAELESLFRFVSLAKIMKYRNAQSEAGINLDYFLNEFPIKNTSLNKTLPGISQVRDFQHKTEFSGGYSTYYLWLPCCGGVSMDITANDKNIERDNTGALAVEKEKVLEIRRSPDSIYSDFTFSSPRFFEFDEIYQNLDKYPGVKNKNVIILDQKDELTIQMGVVGENTHKVEEIHISPTFKEFIEEWNMGDNEIKYDCLNKKIYLRELMYFYDKIENAAGGKEIILDAPQHRDLDDILNLYFGGNFIITTKHSKPKAIAETLNWNEQIKFKPSDIIILYSANPKYSKSFQDERIKEWITSFEEINKNLPQKITLKIIESPEEVFKTMNEVVGKGIVVIRVGETDKDEDGYTIMPKGKLNKEDMQKNVDDNPERVTAVLNCHSIEYDYPDACSKKGAGINIGTTREVQDKEDVIEFIRLLAINLEENSGNLLDASQDAINGRINGRNYYFIKYVRDYLGKNPEDFDGAIKYAEDKVGKNTQETCSGIQLVIDSRGFRNL